MNRKLLVFLGLSITLSANAALYDRGNGMIYDDVLDITWLQDANYAQTSGYDSDGLMNWDDAMTWAAQLSYGGSDDWRLASANLMNPTNPCLAYDGSCDKGWSNTTSELGFMFYTNLGNLASYDINGNSVPSGWGLSNTSFIDATDGDTVDILNLQSMWYWQQEEYAPSNAYAWAFYHYNGFHNASNKLNTYYAWAVHDGDVAAVPLPASAWLFGSALLGLAGFKRRMKP